MQTTEEIRIKAGLDYSRVTAGLNSIRSQVNKLAADVPKKLTGLLKANLYTAAAGIIAEILPTWDEIWNKVYGVDEASTRRLEETSKRLRSVRAEAQAAARAVEDAISKARFEDADTLGKRDILLQQKANQEIDVKAARDEVDRLKGLLARDRSNPELAARLGGAQKDLSVKELELLKTGRSLKSVTEKLSPDAVASIYAEMMANSIPDVATLRAEFAKQMALRRAFNMNGALEQGLIAGEAAKEAMDAIGQIVKARNVQGLAAVAGALPQAGPFGDIKAALEEASKQAMSAVIQRVKIVEVE